MQMLKLHVIIYAIEIVRYFNSFMDVSDKKNQFSMELP